VRRAVLGFVLPLVALTHCGEPFREEEVGPIIPPAGTSAPDVLAYHGADRLGWNATERRLTPEVVASARFGKLWETPRFDDEAVDGKVQHPHLYASPLYVDDAGGGRAMLIAATSNGFVYAIDPFDRGRILWQRRLGAPIVAPALDGGVAVGVLSTPVIDRRTSPPTLYVTNLDASGWQAFGLELSTGNVLPGWPVRIDDAALAPLNTNGPARFQPALHVSQRGALALSPNGERLYVTFGTFAFHGVGWIVSVDTRRPGIARAFSSAPFKEEKSNGGIWAAGGPAITADGRVWVTTGNSPPHSADAPHTWGSSLLRFSPDLDLEAAYTPFNYCKLDDNNLDLSASAPLILPDVTTNATTTPRLLAFGSKQGNVYLIDRDAISPAADRRPPCSSDPSTDRSLHPPGSARPLNVFGPYTDDFGEIDYAKMRTKPAYFKDTNGTTYLYVAGSTKAAADSTDSVAPGLARVRVVLGSQSPAHLAIDGRAPVVFVNPGSPIVTSDGGRGAIVWVLDATARRSASLLDPATPAPVLHAIDGETMSVLYKSKAGELAIGGKYGAPVVARGVVFVGTDRVVAFGASP
jgi:hypothetical protein